MSIYQKDLNLWRKALVKALNEMGLGKGALVRCTNASYNAGHRWVYPKDDDYIAPVGLVMEHSLSDVSHFHGIMNSNTWLESGAWWPSSLVLMLHLMLCGISVMWS